MRLTVGPHPAAVYWRRRAVVLAGLAIVVLIITYACSGSATSSAGPGGSAAGGSSPTPTTTLLRPTIRTPSPHTPTPTPTPTPFTLPTSTVTGACSDAEMAVTAVPARSDVVTGQTVDLTIKIKNTSARACPRDIGADLQELRLLDPGGTTIVWSSDDCGANHGHDVRTFTAGQEVSFTITWNGRRSRSGTGARTCGTDAKALDPMDYLLVARLDQKLSAPTPLHVTA